MSARVAASLLVCVLAGAAPAASAQVAMNLDVGAGSYRPDHSLGGGVASIAPGVSLSAGAFRWHGGGVYTDAPAGRWNFQGSSDAALRVMSLGPIRADLLGRAEWTWHHRVPGTAAVGGGLRAYMAPSSGSVLWVGREVGSAWSLGERRPLERSTVGGSAWFGRARVGITVASTTFDLLRGGGSEAQPTSDTGRTALTDSTRRERRTVFTDAMVTSQWSISAVELTLSLGRRFSRTTPEITLWGVTLLRDLSPQLALLATAGRAGSDPVTALPGARYLAAGIRFKVGGGRGRIVIPDRAASTDTGLRIGPARLIGREILLRVPGARAVELAADFTDWKPVALARTAGSSWRVVLPIAPGLHRMAIRIDGGAWQAPPGTRALRSEFGTEVGEVAID